MRNFKKKAGFGDPPNSPMAETTPLTNPRFHQANAATIYEIDACFVRKPRSESLKT